MRSPFFGVQRLFPVASLLALLGSAGCSSRQFPVHGKVTLEDGTPLTGGLVIFESRVPEGKIPIMARGAIRADGSYELSTSKPGDGARPGKYRVIILPPQPDVDASSKVRSPTFDRRYSDFTTSGLEFEVKAAANDILIQVARPGKGPRT
jgi:hypothetical protein